MKLVYHLIKEGSLDIDENDVEKLKNADLLDELVQEFAATFPSLLETLLVESKSCKESRNVVGDMFLAAQLRKCPGKVVVGVVGLVSCVLCTSDTTGTRQGNHKLLVNSYSRY